MKYSQVVEKVIRDADIVLEVVDARFPEQSRNIQLEENVKWSGKKLLIVLNKADLIGKRAAERIKKSLGERAVFVSAKRKTGTIRIKEEIGKLSGGKEIKVAVVGYPNTGKSSIINMLKGKKSARTSSTAGFTKGKQMVRISARIMLIDTPGVMELGEKDEVLLALLGAKNPQDMKDLEGAGIQVAQMLIDNNPEALLKTYGVEATDGEEFLEKLAIKRNKLMKGARPDVNAIAKILILDYQQGKIGL